MTAPVHVAIMGATGYGAGELLRLLVMHPAAQVVSLTTTSQVGASVGDVHPHLRGFHHDLRLGEAIDLDRLAESEHAVVFSAVPHGASATGIERLLDELGQRGLASRTHVIDLSGDLRLKNLDIHAQHYTKTPAMPSLRQAFVYGLPELHRNEIMSAKLVANPGCLASAAILAVAPLAAGGYHGPLAIDAKTGSSGSGRQLKETTHHPTRHADFRAYKPLSHQHEPEILQALGDPHGDRIALSFVAQSLPVARGIYVTAHATLDTSVDAVLLQQRYTDFYAGSPFVRIVDTAPTLQDVVGSNFCDIGVSCRGKQLLVMAALDNLVKGMSGTAIQNMNLMCGLDETTGLWTPSFRPV